MTAGLFFLLVLVLIAVIVWVVTRLTEFRQDDPRRGNAGVRIYEHGKCGS
jgi:flagellar biogenesis protein FliO